MVDGGRSKIVGINHAMQGAENGITGGSQGLLPKRAPLTAAHHIADYCCCSWRAAGAACLDGGRWRFRINGERHSLKILHSMHF